MKRLLACLIALATFQVHANEATDQLRKEFDEYKKDTEARIQTLEKEAAEKQEAVLTEEELDSIRSTLERSTLDFEFHGYLRSGYGVDDSGDVMSVFQAPNSGAKYRLGNEAETYLETTFLTRAAPKDAGEGASFETKITLAYYTPISDGSEFDATTSLREAFAVAAGVLPDNPTTAFWAGQRFYSRYDAHINDFYYRDMSGYGGGVEGIRIGESTKLAVAWLGGSVDELKSDGTAFVDPDANFNKNNIDFAFTETEVPGGRLDTILTLAYFDGDSFTNTTATVNVDDSGGAAINLFYKIPVNKNGMNIFGVQYGQGAAFNFRAQMTAPRGIDINAITALDTKELETARVLNNIYYDINEKWSVQALALYEVSDFGTAGDSEIRWASIGARPTYHFNRYFSLATEAGCDYTDTDGGESGYVGKLTFAPQITPQSTVLSRPAIRAFFTYAWWDSDFRGAVGSPSYSDEVRGLSAGMQLETWW